MTIAQRVCVATGYPQEDPYLSNAQSVIDAHIEKYNIFNIQDFERMCVDIKALDCCAHISLVIPSLNFRIKPKDCDQDLLFEFLESYFFDFELA